MCDWCLNDSFNADFNLVPADAAAGTAAVLAPEGSRRDQFLEWVATLPDAQPPAWLGLPNNAEMVLLTSMARKLAADMLKLLVRGVLMCGTCDVFGGVATGVLWVCFAAIT